jgi:hypothetical protein
VQDALEAAAFRAGPLGSNVSDMVDHLVGFPVPVSISAVIVNVGAMLEWDNPTRLPITFGIAVVLVTLAIAGLVKFRKPRVEWWLVGLLALVAIVPYVWYATIAEHSARHYWFTYRSQFVTIAALGCAWCRAIDWDAVRTAARRLPISMSRGRP